MYNCFNDRVLIRAVFDLLGAETAESSLTEHTEHSKPKYSGALRFLLVFDVDGEAIDDVADDAATEEAFDVLSVAEDCLERYPPACGFLNLRDVMALEMLLLADETPDAASDWVGR